MSFKDALANEIVTGFGNNISSGEIFVTLGVTVVIAVYLFAVYRVMTENAFYSMNFNISMVAMAVITSGIILAMQSSLVISLGMVGALSIVRFRTAIKEPMDLLFLFWSIGTGIICGAGVFKLAVVLAVVVTLVIIVLKKLPDAMGSQMLFIACDVRDNNEAIDINGMIKSNTKAFRLKSINSSIKSIDYVYEIRCKDSQALLNQLRAIDSISSVSIVDSTGEYRG